MASLLAYIIVCLIYCFIINLGKMGKCSDLSPRKIGQIRVLLQHSKLKQSEIARDLNVSKQTVSLMKKKLKHGHDKPTGRKGKCGRKRKTTMRLDRIIRGKATMDCRKACRRISAEMKGKL